MELTDLSAHELASGYQAKQFSVPDVAAAYLKRIDAENPKLNAYLEVFDDVRTSAEVAQKRIDAGSAHALTGVPIAVKDNILIQGKRVSAASKMLENYVATYDATAISKLKDAGVVFLGRTNMDEFAMGSSTENSAFGPTKNPFDLTRVPGGTSGGSAAAVAAHMAPVALGTDTGGSVRQPASFCGLYGLKPTYGAVSRSGVIAAASSFDQVGAMGRTIGDVEAVFGTIAGPDSLDGTTLPADVRHAQPLKKKIGVPRAFLKEGLEAPVAAALSQTLERLQKVGYELVDVELPNIGLSLATYYILIDAEESTNLARYDGVRYGNDAEGANLLDEYKKSRAEGFGPEVRRRIILGTYILSHGYYDAYYRRANALRALITDDFKKVFLSVDALIMPTSPILPFKIGERSDDPVAMYLADIFTVSPSLAGVPSLNVPVGWGEKDGVKLPVGMQFTATHCAESTLFTIARDVLNEA